MNLGLSIPEVSSPSLECPNPQDWSCYDSEATEVEVLEFLQSLIHMIKPKVAIETGCYHGYGTCYIAEGLKLNGFGKLFTCDIDHNCLMETRCKVARNGLMDLVETSLVTGVELINSIDTEIDFAFLDSAFDGVRTDELKAVLPKLSKRGIVAIHDTSTFHVQNKGPRLETMAICKELDLQLVMFDTPRGLALIRKL